MKVLITGTSNGIGQATALCFLRHHHQVIGVDVLPSTISNERYRHIIADITEPLPEVADVEILVCCAGIQLPDDKAIEVNLKGTINTIERYALQSKIKSVVAVASASASNGAEFPYYVASKGGVVAYIKHVALQVAQYGATANCVSPGGVNTLSNAPVMDDPALYAAALRESLLGKWAEADEIAEWIYFVSAINRSMTGQDVVIDNGEMLRSNFIWPQNQ